MEYIGEHLLPGQLGSFFVSLSLVAAIMSAIAYYLYIKSQNENYKRVARGLFLSHAVAVMGIVGTLFYLLLSHYFEYDYVWKHSSLDLDKRYVFSAFWEGQEGSFILWMFWHAILGVILQFTSKKWEAPAMIVFSAVQAFLSSMILGVLVFGERIGSSPFILMRNTADNFGLPWTKIPDYLERFPNFMDGTGLNPLLQNYWMTIHPPTLFLGFASTLVPFAFAVAALFNRDYKSWVKPALPWAFFSVGILGLGILMGGAWAYEALSFGGFWAWDPVENSSLVPWIVMVGAAHLLLIFRNKRTALTAAFFMSILSFILILYSTFLTRSGVLGDSSVHAFVGLGLSGQLLIYLGFFTLIAFGLLIIRYKHIPKGKKEDDLTSREFWMFIGSLVFLIAAFQIIFSTSIPVINQLIGPEGSFPLLSDAMAPPLDAIEHYNSFQVPFAMVITLLMSIGQYLSYGKTSSKLFWKNSFIAIIVAVIITAVLAQLYDFWSEGLYLTFLFIGVYAAISNFYYWLVLGRRKLSFAGSSVAHIGFALIMVGSLISNAKKDVISQSQVFLSEDLPANENALLEQNDTAALGQYWAVFEGMEKVENDQNYVVSYFNKPGDKNYAFQLSPFLLMSDEMGATPNPDTEHFWNKDIYTHVTYSSYLEPTTGDGFGKEATVELGEGDTALYREHFIVMDSLKVSAGMNEETGEMEQLTLTAVARVINVLGKEYKIRPTYELQGEVLGHTDETLYDAGLRFRFEEVNMETNDIIIKAWSKLDEDQKPFIVMKAIVFPLINLLWIGSILMVIGSFIAVWQRFRLNRA
jgi:cytochrome c-type biogenesis protein CcmF